MVTSSGGWSKRPGGVAEGQDSSTVALFIAFARRLRRAGVAVPVDNVVQYVRAIEAVGADLSLIHI